MSDDDKKQPGPEQNDFWRWLGSATIKVIKRFVWIGGALQVANYILVLDDYFKDWAINERGIILIFTALALIVNLMYEWVVRTKK